MFNALKYTKKLEEVGVSREQAEAHISIMTEVIETNLATKQDLKDLSIELRQDIRDLKAEIEKLEYRMTIKLGTIMTAVLAAMTAIHKFF